MQTTTQYRFFVGVDVSKEHLDFVLYEHKQFIFHKRTPNNIGAVHGFLTACTQKVPTLLFEQVLFCLEHTGMYGYPLISALLQAKVAIWIESGLKISRSLGLQRGKNDKLDAQNIAQFAYRYQDKVKLYQPASEQLQQLEALFVLRSRLVKLKNNYSHH